MADPQADPNRPPGSNPSDGPPPPLPGSPEPSDDTPTVITRTAPLPVPAEGAFPATLRGRQLAHFELLEAVGVGGMAAVIRARDTQLDRPVALKILPPEMAVDPENVRRFHQEARAAAKLDHENIARVFFCGEDQGLHFIAFEFVEGENLRTILDRRGKLSVGEAVNYVLQVATGLAHAAARGVVHRDIKPSNIIVSSNGRAKLVDMGLARSLEPQGDNGLTQSGVTLGTFDYISPEQALEPREADVRSDIYSLGCTFYHMLTGRAPVPEGTAAKKLHHHQHVAPIDPRQLNPDIPDELAAILAHMMAKDPRHRYQRAEHLVQHLLHLAQKLGGVAEASEGVLFVDTALPHPPHSRPLLVGGAALVVLAVLVVGLGMIAPPASVGLPGGPAEGEPANPVGEVAVMSNGSAAAPEATPQGPARTKPPAPPPTLRKDCGTAAELAHFLSEFTSATQKSTVADVALTGDLKFGADGAPGAPPGLVFAGRNRQLTIRPKDRTRRPTIRLVYDAGLRDDGAGGDPAWTALTIKGGRVVLKDLRFEVSAAQGQIMMAAIRAQENASVSLEGCEFILTNPPRTDPKYWLSAVEVADAKADFKKCYFSTEERKSKLTEQATRGNQSAFTLSGGGIIDAENCAFASSPVLSRLRKGSGQAPKLTLSRCSAFLGEGAAFQVEGTSCNLIVRDCLFSNPDQGMMAGTTTLIHQTGDEGTITFQGDENRYHHLSAYWTQATPGEAPSVDPWSDFQTRVAKAGGHDRNAQVLPVSPWTDKDPLARLREGHPALAFAPDQKLRELRRVDDAGQIVGVWGDVYDKPAPPLEPRNPNGLVAKVVDPEVKEAGGGVYPTLASAIEEVKKGEIQIRHDGPVPIKPVELTQATADITLKPAPGFHPVLTLGETSNKDAALFRLGDGKLRLEGLEFYLRPGQKGFTAQSVVDMIGGGECQFKSCVATLEEPDGKPLALVMLTDPSQVMKMESTTPRQQTPRVQVERCFIRGQGDLLAVRATRPLFLNVTNSLVALAGSFLNVEGNARDPLKAEPIKVELKQVTAYLTDNLVCLRAKEGKGPVPVQVNKAANCLFVSASGKAFVHLDGLEALDFQMRNQFSWENGQQNTYSKFQPMLDQKPKGGDDMGMGMQPFDQQKWKSFTNEADGVFTPVEFANPPDANAATLSSATPAQFKLKVKIKGETVPPTCGAEIDQLPRPFSPQGETETPGK